MAGADAHQQSSSGQAPPPQYMYSLDVAQHYIKKEYSPRHLSAVKWLTIIQLILGLVIFVLHFTTTMFNVAVYQRIETLKNEFHVIVDLMNMFADRGATGVWVGFLVVLSASIGISGYRTQSKCRIVGHLVLNLLLMFCYIALMATLSITISSLVHCKSHGVFYSRSIYITAPVDFFGEYLYSRTSYYVYCKNALFTIWRSFDAIIIFCAVFELFITFALIVYNCVAVCLCCRTCGCCGNCGYESPSGQVARYTQSPIAAPPPILQPQYVPIASGTTVIAGHVHQPLASVAMYGTPVFSAVAPPPYVASSPSVNSHAAGDDRKGEDLPPAYQEVYGDQ